jgi:hypothetical protein
MMDRGTVETCRVSLQNKFEKLVRLVKDTETVFFRLPDFFHATQATVDNDVLPIYVAKQFEASGL